MIPELWPYQMDCCLRVIEAARQGHRIIVMQGPCGSGKTNQGCYLTKRAVDKGKRVLVMVQLRKLVDQFSERLLQFHIQHGIIMRERESDRSCLVQVASKDTLLSRCVKHEWIGLPPADLVLVDEGRHAAAPEYRRLLKFYEDNGARIILMDATPALSDGSGLGPWAQAMVQSAKVTDLVRDGYLVPVRCYAPDRKMRGAKVKRGIAGDLVDSWKQFAENRPTVLFTSRVSHSHDAVSAYKANGIPAAHVDADTPEDERERMFECLESGEIKVVSNVGIIREGVDIPCLGCVQYYMDPSGRVGFIQGASRVMRRYPGKEYGILIDHAGCVFRHGFPDEDMEWTLVGNVDSDFNKAKADGNTDPAQFCKKCNLVYHNSLACPQCGRLPSKPPRSIFAPPPVDSTDELLTEAERGEKLQIYGRDAKVKHWIACLAMTVNRNDGTFGQAAQVYKRKYNEWPQDDFPKMPSRNQWKQAVSSVFPDFCKRRKA